jgi:hypothetical protein
MDEQKNTPEFNITENSSMADILRELVEAAKAGAFLVKLENQDLLKWIDVEVKAHKYRNYSHLVEAALLRMKDENRLP